MDLRPMPSRHFYSDGLRLFQSISREHNITSFSRPYQTQSFPVNRQNRLVALSTRAAD